MLGYVVVPLTVYPKIFEGHRQGTFFCMRVDLNVAAAEWYEGQTCVQGVTFRVENGELVIARILHGGMIDQQGLLHVGDIIKEVNGKEVGNDPKVLQEMLKEASGSVVLKILPSYQEPHTARQVSGQNMRTVSFTFLQLDSSTCSPLNL